MTTWSPTPAQEGESLGLSLSDPLDLSSPFAIAALPTSLDLPDWAIDDAFTRFCAFYHHNEAILKRAKSARDIVAQRSERITILHANEVTVCGSSTYRIRRDEAQGVFCTCRDYWVAKRQQQHGGACKHIIAVEILRMAAVTTNTASEAEESSDLAFVSLHTPVLAAALADIGDHAIRLTIDGSRLSLHPGPTLEGCDGDGHATIALAMASITTLRQAVQQDSVPNQIQIYLDRSDNSVTLSASAWYVQVLGTSIAL